MKNFEFVSVGRIIFGRGQFARIGELACSLGRRALVVHNAEWPARGGRAARAMDLLASAGVQPVAFRQRGEPTVSDVEQGVTLAAAEGCDLVIGVGGGSAIDAAKAVAGVLANGGSVLDYLEVVGRGRKIRVPAVPWIAVPTTGGTGAEVTRNAVIGWPERKFKASIRSEHLLARVAVVDPELAVDVAAEVTARSGMDALCQLIESYTSTGAHAMTDGLAMQGIALAARSLRRAWRDGTDLDAREDMALAAMLSGITLTNAGLGAVHGLAAPLGAGFPIPHGTVCAALLPPVMRANVSHLRGQSADHPALGRYAAIGRLLAAQPHLADADAIEAGIEAVRRLAGDLGIPRLGRFGLRPEDCPAVAALARKASSMRFNPVELGEEVLCEILLQAI